MSFYLMVPLSYLPFEHSNKTQLTLLQIVPTFVLLKAEGSVVALLSSYFRSFLCFLLSSLQEHVRGQREVIFPILEFHE